MARGIGGHSAANVTHSLRGVGFPAKKDDLIRQAKTNEASGEVLDTIEQMGEGPYDTMAVVMKELGHVG